MSARDLFSHAPGSQDGARLHRARAEAAESKAAALPVGDPLRADLEKIAADARARLGKPGPYSLEQRDNKLRRDNKRKGGRC